MALLVGELKAALGLDDSKFDKGLDASQAKFGKFGKKLETDADQAGKEVGGRFGIGFSKRIPEIGGRVTSFFKTGIGTAAGLAAGAVVGGSLVEGLKGALEQGDVKAKFEAQLDLSGPEAAKAGKIAGDLYTSNYGESLADVNDAIRSVVQNTNVGLNSIDLKPVTGKVMDLVSVFDQDLGGVTRAVGQSIRTGLAKNATEALDFITKGFQVGDDKAEDFLDTLNEYGTQFRKVGIDGKTATGLISQGLKAGARDADIVADAIKEFSIRAVDGSTTTAAGFKSLGIDAKKMSETIAKGGKPASDGLQLVLDKLRDIKDPVKRSQVAIELFGTQAEDLGDALFALDPKHAVDAIGQVGGAADRLDKKVGTTPQAIISGYWRTIKQGSTDAFAGVVQAFASGTTTATGFQGFLERFAVDARKVFDRVRDGAGELKGLGLRIVQAIGPVDLSGISAGILADTKAWAGSVISGLKLGLDTGDWQPLGKSLGDGVVRSIQTLGDKSGVILDAVGGLIDKVDWGSLGTKISTGITGLFKGVDWKALGSALGDEAISVLDKASDVGQKLGTAFKTLVNKIDWKQIGNDSTASIIGFVSGVDWAQVAKALAIAVLKSLKINVQVHDAVIAGARDLVIGMFKAIIDAMATWKVNVNAYVRRVGGELVAGLWGGIKSGMKGAGNFLKTNVVDPVVNWVKSLFGVHSPSTVFIAIGIALIVGLKNGIVSAASGIGRWIYSNVISPVVTPFGQAGSWLVQHGRNAVAGFKSGVSGVAKGIGRWMYDHIISPAVAPFGKAGTWLNSAGRNVIAGFKNGMVEIWGDVTKWVGGIATWIKDHKGPVSLDGRLLIPAGRAIMSGFLKGLKSGAGTAWNFVQSVGGKTKQALFDAIGGGFSGGGGPAPTNLSAMQALVRTIATQRGWGSGYQWDALYQLIQHESGFNPNAQNPTSSAYGLFQFLNSTWGSVGASKTSDPWGQTAAGLRYIANAYGSPAQAWAAWQSRSPHWYDKGTPWIPDDQLAYVHKGEMVVPADVARYLRRPRPNFLGSGRVRSKLHQLHEAHQAHVAHVNHVNHLGRGRRSVGVGADLTSNGVTGVIRLHPESVRDVARALAREITANPLQVFMDSRRVDIAMSSAALRGF